jgi:hypothetical protein
MQFASALCLHMMLSSLEYKYLYPTPTKYQGALENVASGMDFVGRSAVVLYVRRASQQQKTPAQ